jgi:hypothetical protein
VQYRIKQMAGGTYRASALGTPTQALAVYSGVLWFAQRAGGRRTDELLEPADQLAVVLLGPLRVPCAGRCEPEVGVQLSLGKNETDYSKNGLLKTGLLRIVALSESSSECFQWG